VACKVTRSYSLLLYVKQHIGRYNGLSNQYFKTGHYKFVPYCTVKNHKTSNIVADTCGCWKKSVTKYETECS